MNTLIKFLIQCQTSPLYFHSIYGAVTYYNVNQQHLVFSACGKEYNTDWSNLQNTWKIVAVEPKVIETYLNIYNEIITEIPTFDNILAYQKSVENNTKNDFYTNLKIQTIIKLTGNIVFPYQALGKIKCTDAMDEYGYNNGEEVIILSSRASDYKVKAVDGRTKAVRTRHLEITSSTNIKDTVKKWKKILKKIKEEYEIFSK